MGFDIYGARTTSWKLCGIDCQSGESLCDVVVQLTREPAPFVFMRGDQPPAQGRGLFFGLSATGALPQQSNQQRHLHRKDTSDRDEQGAMFVPKQRRPK